jgi:hypothetical protein
LKIHISSEYYVSRDLIKLCEIFADRVISTNKHQYEKRNQFNPKKIWNDIFQGKIAEWGVYFIYSERGVNNIDPPDMKIYKARDKSFDADLKFGMFNLHIKSQTYQSSMRYGDSWIFQAKDPLFESASEYDIVIGCRISLDQSCETFIEGAFVEIKLEKAFHNLIIGETKLSKFSENKKAIYLKDNNG